MERILILLSVTIGFLAAGTSVAQEKDWVKKQKNEKLSSDRYMQFVGTGSTAEEAETQALLGIARMIEVTITGEQKYESTEEIKGKKGEISSKVQESSRASVHLNLQGLRIEDRDFRKKDKTHFALAVLDRQVAGQALRAEIADRDKRFRSFIDQSKVLFDNKSYYEAIEKLIVCHGELKHINEQVKKIRVILPDAEFEKSIAKGPEEAKILSMLDAIGKDQEHSTLDVVTALLMFKLYDTFEQYASSTSVVIGNFNYKDTKMSSAFTAYFKEKMEIELGKVSGIKVIGSRTVSQYLKSHGIEFDGTAQGLAKISGADATIVGSYWELDDRIELKTQIVGRVTGETLGSAHITFPSALIPKSISLKPDNFSQIQSDLALLKDNPSGSELKVVVWTDRGDGGVYKEKEKLLVYVKSNKDCYVKVVYHDASGKNIQVFPNSYSEKTVKITANTVYTIGGEDSPFTFEVSEPFGTELIKAFASTTPLPEPDASDLQDAGNGMFIIKKSTRDMVAMFKGKTAQSGDFAESSVSLTTVKDLPH